MTFLSSLIVSVQLVVFASAINKCCPENQYFDEMLECVDRSPDYNSSYTWLPENVNPSAAIVKYNATPCSIEHSKADVFSYSGYNVTVSGALLKLDNGSIVEFSEKSYCLDQLQDEENYYRIVYLCPCIEYLCLWKCCPDRKHLHVKDKNGTGALGCASSHLSNWNHGLLNGTRVERYHNVLPGLRKCASKRSMDHLRGSYRLLEDGSIHSEQDGVILPQDYCGDFLTDGDNTVTTILACFDLDSEKHVMVYVVITSLGVMFLLVTTLLYLWLTEMGGLNRWMVALHSGCLLVAYLWYMALQVVSATVICKTAGYAMQFSFLAAFFWLNVMCLDMSWTFSGIRPPSGSQRDRDRRKFVWYSLYAWGGSSAITMIALIVEYAPGVPANSPFKPNVGVIKCWFKEAEAIWVYFYGPMAILLITNLFLFIYTTYKILVLKRGTGALHQADSARHGGGHSPGNKDKQRFVLYAKLFSLMGVTWLTEIISWAAGGPNYIWYFTDAINLLRAVFIFIIFCWKPRVWSAIKKRLACARKFEQVVYRLCCPSRNPDLIEEPKTSSTAHSRAQSSVKEAAEMKRI